MNKLFVALPVLALLALGSVFVFQHKTVESAVTVDFHTWQGCITNPKDKHYICDDITTSDTELYQCYAVANQFHTLYGDATIDNATADCKVFQDDFLSSDATDNFSNSFPKCMDSITSAIDVKKSAFFYKNIFSKYLTCAGISA